MRLGAIIESGEKFHLDSGSRTRLASDPMPLGFHNAVWSPDGRRLAYFSSKAGTRALYISAVNEVTQEEERWESSNDIFATASDWTPDANFLILTERPLPTGEQRISVCLCSEKADHSL